MTPHRQTIPSQSTLMQVLLIGLLLAAFTYAAASQRAQRGTTRTSTTSRMNWHRTAGLEMDRLPTGPSRSPSLSGYQKSRTAPSWHPAEGVRRDQFPSMPSGRADRRLRRRTEMDRKRRLSTQSRPSG
eukprot:scaffold66917_cov45-Prasinocladus_malaysianus.AAC.4